LISQYTDAITTDSSDDFLSIYFHYERALLRECSGMCRKELECYFMGSMGLGYSRDDNLDGAQGTWIKTVASEQYNALSQALQKVQLRKHNRFIRLRHAPPERQTRNAARNGMKCDENKIVMEAIKEKQECFVWILKCLI
jgi:hypothetical protein